MATSHSDNFRVYTFFAGVFAGVGAGLLVVSILLWTAQLITTPSTLVETPKDTLYIPTVFQDTVFDDNKIATVVKVRNKEFVVFKFGKSITACPY
jgi:hypothetical protein